MPFLRNEASVFRREGGCSRGSDLLAIILRPAQASSHYRHRFFQTKAYLILIETLLRWRYFKQRYVFFLLVYEFTYLRLSSSLQSNRQQVPIFLRSFCASLICQHYGRLPRWRSMTDVAGLKLSGAACVGERTNVWRNTQAVRELLNGKTVQIS